MIVLDTAFLYALLDRREPRHGAAVSWYGQVADELATTPLVLAEMDYLSETRGGRSARTAFRRDVAAGAYVVGWWPEATAQTVEIAERYADLGVTLTDASLVALAARLGTVSIATFDERHFRAMRPLAGGAALRLLPADA